MLLIWADKPVTSTFPHHNALVNKFATQAGNVIMKCLQNGVDLFFRVQSSPFEGSCQFFHYISPFLILGRYTHQPSIFYKGSYHTSFLIAFRWQGFACQEHASDMLYAL